MKKFTLASVFFVSTLALAQSGSDQVSLQSLAPAIPGLKVDVSINDYTKVKHMILAGINANFGNNVVKADAAPPSLDSNKDSKSIDCIHDQATALNDFFGTAAGQALQARGIKNVKLVLERSKVKSNLGGKMLLSSYSKNSGSVDAEERAKRYVDSLKRFDLPWIAAQDDSGGKKKKDRHAKAVKDLSSNTLELHFSEHRKGQCQMLSAQDLAKEAVENLGSVMRRQATAQTVVATSGAATPTQTGSTSTGGMAQ